MHELGERDSTTIRRLLPKEGEETGTVLAVLPWLGVPVLVSAVLADAGRPLPGEILPVVGFLPLGALAYVAAVSAPAERRAWMVGLPGWLALVGLLAFLGRDPAPGVARTFWVAVAAAVASTVGAGLLGRGVPRTRPLATWIGAALVFSQGLDGWLTYFAVGNPFGWLSEPVAERVLVSRILLDVAPALYPLLKVTLGVAIVLMLGRNPPRAPMLVAAALGVCYVGLSPAMFSAANLFGR